MSEESKVSKTPWDLPPFSGDIGTPTAGSDLEKLNAWATTMPAAEINALGAEMRSRYLTSANLNPSVKPLPETTTEGNGVMAGWTWNGKQR
jgi:hypothetical protein